LPLPLEAYQIREILDQFHIDFTNVLDIGAAPGGWSQLISEELYSGDTEPVVSAGVDNIYSIDLTLSKETKVTKRPGEGNLVSLDKRQFQPIHSRAQMITGDFCSSETLDQLDQLKFDLIMADVFPFEQTAKCNVAAAQETIIGHLTPLLTRFLLPNGSLIVRMPGPLEKNTQKRLLKKFAKVEHHQPHARRAADSFVIGLKFHS